jgi:chemotaxis protein methyltransferase CheR
MQDRECVALLQWMLPALGLRWAGFRRVRKQVCKRISRRIAELGLASATDYRGYLNAHREEWSVADALCTVTITRFYRDKGVFAYLGSTVLPELGRRALDEGRTDLRAWSAGCGSGEEPYTLSLVWHFEVGSELPGLTLRILGTDIDDRLLRRAHEAVYPAGCLTDLPEPWRVAAFDATRAGLRLKPAHRDNVTFLRHDLRGEPPAGPFDLVLCRNLAFTYFDDATQLETAQRLRAALTEGGALVLGRHERLPAGAPGFSAWSAGHKIYRASPAPQLVATLASRCAT